MPAIFRRVFGELAGLGAPGHPRRRTGTSEPVFRSGATARLVVGPQDVRCLVLEG
jgi:hypothetical protein